MGTEEPQVPDSSEALIIATQYTASVKNPDLRGSLTRVIVKALTPRRLSEISDRHEVVSG